MFLFYIIMYIGWCINACEANSKVNNFCGKKNRLRILAHERFFIPQKLTIVSNSCLLYTLNGNHLCFLVPASILHYLPPPRYQLSPIVNRNILQNETSQLISSSLISFHLSLHYMFITIKNMLKKWCRE